MKRRIWIGSLLLVAAFLTWLLFKPSPPKRDQLPFAIPSGNFPSGMAIPSIAPSRYYPTPPPPLPPDPQMIARAQGPDGEKATIRLTVGDITYEMATYPRLQREGSGWRITAKIGNAIETLSIGAPGWQVGTYPLSITGTVSGMRLEGQSGTLTITQSDSKTLQGSFQADAPVFVRLPPSEFPRPPQRGTGAGRNRNRGKDRPPDIPQSPYPNPPFKPGPITGTFYCELGK